MWHALNAQHQKFGGLLEACHYAMMASDHFVPAIDRHDYKLGTPDHRRTAQRI
jgi:hypothetical protein